MEKLLFHHVFYLGSVAVLHAQMQLPEATVSPQNVQLAIGKSDANLVFVVRLLAGAPHHKTRDSNEMFALG